VFVGENNTSLCHAGCTATAAVFVGMVSVVVVELVVYVVITHGLASCAKLIVQILVRVFFGVTLGNIDEVDTSKMYLLSRTLLLLFLL
jgi:hypothetical protein